ncbi:hypothetical protein E6C60_1496 [Paenibacillus algicola]|uniref:Uncharacterized protein n=1 Tax=Paenibacillus algicola TaxID=2565926 RepID=A0A4P8XI12_9BACL|nr:hypothetical protein E6C60_1496 [Paenibacillus algicola]
MHTIKNHLANVAMGLRFFLDDAFFFCPAALERALGGRLG